MYIDISIFTFHFDSITFYHLQLKSIYSTSFTFHFDSITLGLGKLQSRNIKYLHFTLILLH